MKTALADHGLSAAGQLAAALPPLVMLAVLARTAGLPAAGSFAVSAAACAAVFAVSMWGMRTGVLLDRFAQVPPIAWVRARLAALSVAAVIVLAGGLAAGADLVLLAGLVLYKFADGLVDLDLATRQAVAGGRQAFAAFARVHAAKLIVLAAGLAGAAFWLSLPVGPVFVACGSTAVVLAALQLASGLPEGKPDAVRVLHLFARTRWFALAVASCALLATAPRISIGLLYSGDRLGVVGGTLSACTLFGMVFNTTWLRHMPQFHDAPGYQARALAFYAELALVAVLALGLAWTVLPAVIAAFVGFDAQLYAPVASNILAASVLFFAGMSSCNLYKVTARPLLESAAYGVALLAIAVSLIAGVESVAVLLAMAGTLLFVFGVLASLQAFHAPNDASVEGGAGA